MKNIKQGGYVWLITLLIIAVVVGIIWTKRSSVVVPNESGQASSTAEIIDNANEVVNKSEPTKVSPPKSTTSAQPTMTSSGAYIVYYGANGFSPASLNIPAGKSVHFVNNSSNSSMFITPVDKINNPYSSFTQSKSVGKGGTFDYLFTISGSYAYYNGNKDTHGGLITVR